MIGSNGCDSTVTLNLTVITQITSFISQSGNDILANALGGNTPYSYECNTGETSNQITPNANGDYWVIITDVNGCVSDTSFINVEWVSTSVEDLNIDKLNIYPNPSVDGMIQFNVQDHSTFLVYDIFGSLLFEDNVSRGLNKLDLSFLASGTYLINLVGDLNYSSSIWIRN